MHGEKPARITGSNRARVLKLASRVRRPKFRLGELVHNPRDPEGAILAGEDDLRRA
jgi:hypothetical protein